MAQKERLFHSLPQAISDERYKKVSSDLDYHIRKKKTKTTPHLPILLDESGTQFVSDSQKAMGLGKYFASVYSDTNTSEDMDHFTHFLLDDTQREPTLYCMSGLTTLAVYPRKGKRYMHVILVDEDVWILLVLNSIDKVLHINAIWGVLELRRYLDKLG
ncbi:hypothetical protein OSTOST_19667 [Ostertagia ostertagi]